MTPYYSHGGITIYHGNCLEIMAQIECPRLAVTDPPYGILHKSARGASWKNTSIAGDSDTSIRDIVVSHFPEVASFGTWKTPPIERTRGTIVWDKGPAFGMGDLSFPFKPSWELVYIRGDAWSGRRDEGVWRGQIVVSWESRGRVHPHEKPVSLLTYLLSKHPDNSVIDPFMGSGPTLRAAKDLGKTAIGIEIEERYCEIAARRLEQEVLAL